MSARGKMPTLRLLLKIMYRCSSAKIYVTLGVQLKMKYHAIKSNFGTLKLDESRFIMKSLN